MRARLLLFCACASTSAKHTNRTTAATPQAGGKIIKWSQIVIYDTPRTAHTDRCLKALGSSPSATLQYDFGYRVAIGNSAARYWQARALAQFSQWRFEVPPSYAKKWRGYQSQLPMSVEPSGKKSNLAAAERVCRCDDLRFPHLCGGGWSELAAEIIQDTGIALRRFAGERNLGAPKHEVAIHYRCNAKSMNTAEQPSYSYYKQVFASLSNELPRAFSVAIISKIEDDDKTCQALRGSLMAYVSEILADRAKVTLEGGGDQSVDLHAMVSAPVFVGTISSFSLMAAKAHPRRAFMPGYLSTASKRDHVTYLNAARVNVFQTIQKYPKNGVSVIEKFQRSH